MNELSGLARGSLYVLMVLMGLFSVLIGYWQVQILRGKSFKNPDGSCDDWHIQKTHYGIAFADAFLACPATLAGIALIFIAPRWGFYLLALASFWWVWGNLMTTATSLRFEKPKITLMWFVTFPLGALIGLAYIIWTVVNFEAIYL